MTLNKQTPLLDAFIEFFSLGPRPADANCVLGKIFQIAVSIVRNALILVTFCGENCFDRLPNPIEIGYDQSTARTNFFSKNCH